ncbi:hypothetical protein Tco_0467117, partial [Tanacetum coccineum]
IATGMHTFSFIFYSNALAFLILLPAAFLVHRSPNRPALTSSVAGGFLVVGMIGYPKFTYTLLPFKVLVWS